VKEKKVQKRYNEEFKRRAGAVDSQWQEADAGGSGARVSDYTLTLWKRAYLGQLKPGELEGKPLSPEVEW